MSPDLCRSFIACFELTNIAGGHVDYQADIADLNDLKRQQCMDDGRSRKTAVSICYRAL